MTPLRWLALAGIAALLALLGARMIALQRSPGAAESLRNAQAQLRSGRPEAAAATARAVLAREPLHGAAFGVLARALEGQGGEADDLARYRTAARRAPRDAQVRAWLAAHHLRRGEYADALVHIDALLTVSPGSREEVLATVAGLAQDPAFAAALADHLGERPRWRRDVLRAAIAQEAPTAGDNLHGALRARGDLSADEAARWLDGMLAGGRWGTAYAHWASGLADPADAPATLPVPYNGSFATPPSSAGFDWRLRRTDGVLFDRVAGPHGGRAARLTFLGRAVARPGLEQPLLLGPGRYRLSLRARAQDLQSDQGLEWTLTCSDGRTRIGNGARLRRASGWTLLAFDFEVPADGCEGQWLRLVNPAPRGVAQILRGEIDVTDIVIAPVR